MTSSLEKNKDGVPSYDGTAEKLALFREEALAYTFTLEVHKRYLAGPRLAKELTGVARTVVRRKLAQDPQWLAHPRGAYVLIDFLEKAIESPTLVQASNYIHRFFYQLKRRRGETMTEWVNRHSESMWEASRALKRVQKEYGTPQEESKRDDHSGRSAEPARRSSFQENPWSSWRNDYYRHREQEPAVFDDHGRLPEDEDDPEDGRASHHPSTGGWSDWDWNSHGWRDWYQGDTWRSEEYQPPVGWEIDVPDFLPYLTGFLLLNRSGLDAHERANILAAIRGSFSVESIERALKEQWRDDDLARRDKQRQYANLASLDEDEEGVEEDALHADLEVPDPDREPGAYDAFMADQREIDSCLEAIRDHKRTLKEARWRQQHVKSNRKFFPSKPYRQSWNDRGARGDHTTSRSSSSTTSKTCLACGGDHPTQNCPKPRPKAQVAEEEAEVAFCAQKASHQEALHAESVESALPADGHREKGLSNAVLTGKGSSYRLWSHVHPWIHRCSGKDYGGQQATPWLRTCSSTS